MQLARVLCIAGMIYVHVPVAASPLADSSLITGSAKAVELFITSGFGRAGACLLSVVSGVLTADRLLHGGARPMAMYRRRLSTIVQPMLFWSTVTVLVYAVVSLQQPTFLHVDEPGFLQRAVHYVNLLVFVTDAPSGATMHLAFLRDLFVCILLSPLLILVLRQLPGSLLAALTMLYVLDLESWVMLRPLVLLGFTVGLWLVLSGCDLQRLDRGWLLLLGLFLAASLLIMQFDRGALGRLDLMLAQQHIDVRESVLFPLSRLSGALCLWTLCGQPRMRQVLSYILPLAPYLFATYCSHALFLNLLFRGLWVPLLGDHNAVLNLAWFLMSPVAALLMAIGFVHLIAGVSPSTAQRCLGGRELPARLVWREMRT